MKKILLVCVVFNIMVISVTAEDADQNLRERFSFNWNVAFHAQPEVFSRTSVLGLGIILFDNERIDIQNQLEFCNGVMIMEDIDVKYYKKSLMEKISVGKLTHGGLLRPFGFLEGGIGTCGEDLYDVFANPLIWNVGLGTGLNIFATKNWSFSLEVGFLGNIYEGVFIAQQGFELGVMGHF